MHASVISDVDSVHGPCVQVSDVDTGFQFRADMYKHMGIELPRKPPKKVLFWFRTPPLYRSVLNKEEILAVVNYYNLSYTCATARLHTCPLLAITCCAAWCSLHLQIH